MRLLITGGNSRLARASAYSFPGNVFIRLVDQSFQGPPPPGVEWREGDLRDPGFVVDCLEGIDTILHLAPIAEGQEEAPELLDRAGRGTYVLLDTALRHEVRQIVLGSTLDLFEGFPPCFKVDESWRPRPQPEPRQLASWLAELSCRESIRTSLEARAVCLRFGQIVDESEIASQPYDPRWVYLGDAIQGIQCALAYLYNDERPGGWRVFHITAPGDGAKVRLAAAGKKEFGYQPSWDFREQYPTRSDDPAPLTGSSWREFLRDPHPVESRKLRRVVIFGAGGPVASAVAARLANSCSLRLADLRPVEEIIHENKPQFPGAPMPEQPAPPHEWKIVDIRDPVAVMAACEGMDAIINCTVIREHPTDAFLVNMIGAYHVMQAAVRHRIRRIVHTGPQQAAMDSSVGYRMDYDIPGNMLARPGRSLYAHSKFLGQEICRVFADYYGLEVPTLLFMQFLNPAFGGGISPFAVSWEDAARAIKSALRVESLPSPFETIHITADLPQGRYSAQRARELLGWQAEDHFADRWLRR